MSRQQPEIPDLNISKEQFDTDNEPPMYPEFEKKDIKQFEIPWNNNQIEKNSTSPVPNDYIRSTIVGNFMDIPTPYNCASRDFNPETKIAKNNMQIELISFDTALNLNSGFAAGDNFYPESQRCLTIAEDSRQYGDSGGLASSEIHAAVPKTNLGMSDSIFGISQDLRIIKNCFKKSSFEYKRFGILILNRTLKHLQLIVEGYKAEYGKDLLSLITKETSGSVRYLFLSLLYPVYIREAYWLNYATNGVNVDTSTINEIMGTKTKDQIMCIKEAFSNLNSVTLQFTINSLSENEYRKYLTVLCSEIRSINIKIDKDTIDGVVMRIHTSTASSSSKSDSVLAEIFAHSSEMRINEISYAFEQKFNTDLVEYLKNVVSGSLGDILLRRISYCHNPLIFYCENLYNAVQRKDKYTLIRIIVSRATVDLSMILVHYKALYRETLQDDIKKTFKSYTAAALYHFVGEVAQRNVVPVPR